MTSGQIWAGWLKAPLFWLRNVIFGHARNDDCFFSVVVLCVLGNAVI